ncbi:MAG: FtsX-like permease family protein [Terracoccus sp.]
MTATIDRAADHAESGTRPEPSRRAQWWAGWRVSLRLARRDVRRHRGRSALVLLMIGLPVMLLAFGATLAMTADRTAAENAPYLYGTGVAVVSGPNGPKAIEQSADGNGPGWGDDSTSAQIITGFTTDPTAAISSLVGGKAMPFENPDLRATIDGSRTPVPALAITLPAGADLGQRAHLISGRWATSPDEVVVTRYGADLGLPTSGRIDLEATAGSGPPGLGGSPTGESTTGRTIVGLADAVTGSSSGSVSPAAVVVPFDGTPSSWLVTDAKPIDWAGVQRLNRYSLLVTSKAVTSLPADELTRLSPDASTGGQTRSLTTAIAAASGALLLTTTLLAGPAFAVSASRQRRTLALAAANGGTVAQVRQFVLGQAVVLGSLAAVIGVVLGLAGFFGLRALPLRPFLPLVFFSPDVPWSLLALVVAAALVSAVVAALIPARSLGRLDIVRVLRGQEVSRPLRHRLTALGVVLCGIGALTALTRTLTDSGVSVTAFLIGSVVLTIGALCLVPALLVVTARLAGRLPLTMRMAARDSARQRARTAPTVAAVLATTALFSASCIGLASDTAKRADTYVPQVAMGTGLVRAYSGSGATADEDRAVDAIHAAAPDLTVLRAATLGDPFQTTSSLAGITAVPSQRIAAMRAGCSAQQALANSDQAGPDIDCWSLTNVGYGGGQVRVLPATDLTAALKLDPAQAAAVAGGAIVLPDPATLPQEPRHATLEMAPTTPVDVTDAKVAFATEQGTRDPQTNEFTTSGRPAETRVPALLLPAATFLRLQTGSGIGAVLSTETAARLGWTSTPDTVLFYSPDGAVDVATQARVQTVLEGRFNQAMVYVERGFQRGDLAVVLVLIGVVTLLVLVATFVSTALSLAEQQPLMGTLAAVGATRGTRRRMAASQALHLAGLGALIGAAVGLVPGIAIARATTVVTQYNGVSERTAGPFLSIPWLQIIAPVVLVPLIAAAFAWLAVRRSPQVTRRLS